MLRRLAVLRRLFARAVAATGGKPEMARVSRICANGRHVREADNFLDLRKRQASFRLPYCFYNIYGAYVCY
jgi:hypothetical protein